MYLNKHRFQFNFWRRFLGTSLSLFLVSLSQEYLKSAELFVAVALFLGLLSAAAIYAATRDSGLIKFIRSVGFIILVGACSSLLLEGSCYLIVFGFCSPRPFQTTIASFFIFPLFGLLLCVILTFLGSFSKKGYHA